MPSEAPQSRSLPEAYSTQALRILDCLFPEISALANRPFMLQSLLSFYQLKSQCYAMKNMSGMLTLSFDFSDRLVEDYAARQMAKKYERLIQSEAESLQALCNPSCEEAATGPKKMHWAVREAIEKRNAAKKYHY